MITINGKKYAKNDAEFTESLFQADGTCVGYYKKIKNGIQLMNMQKELFAFVVGNKYQEYFFVSAGRLENGKAFYMHGLSSVDAQKLGIENTDSSDQYELAKQLCNEVRASYIQNTIGQPCNAVVAIEIKIIGRNQKMFELIKNKYDNAEYKNMDSGDYSAEEAIGFLLTKLTILFSLLSAVEPIEKAIEHCYLADEESVVDKHIVKHYGMKDITIGQLRTLSIIVSGAKEGGK